MKRTVSTVSAGGLAVAALLLPASASAEVGLSCSLDKSGNSVCKPIILTPPPPSGEPLPAPAPKGCGNSSNSPACRP